MWRSNALICIKLPPFILDAYTVPFCSPLIVYTFLTCCLPNSLLWCNVVDVNCSVSQILCGAEGGPRICIDSEWICDGEIDCPLGWDESQAINNCSSKSACV